jgi:hypothetical protein
MFLIDEAKIGHIRSEWRVRGRPSLFGGRSAIRLCRLLEFGYPDLCMLLYLHGLIGVAWGRDQDVFADSKDSEGCVPILVSWTRMQYRCGNVYSYYDPFQQICY